MGISPRLSYGGGNAYNALCHYDKYRASVVPWSCRSRSRFAGPNFPLASLLFSTPIEQGGRPVPPAPLGSPPPPLRSRCSCRPPLPSGADTHNVLYPGKCKRKMFHKSTIPHTTLLVERASLSAFSEKRFQASRVELADHLIIYAIFENIKFILQIFYNKNS